MEKTIYNIIKKNIKNKKIDKNELTKLIKIINETINDEIKMENIILFFNKDEIYYLKENTDLPNLTVQVLTIPDFNNNDERDIFYRKICNDILICDKYNLIWNQYIKIETLPQPEQKSPEWFQMRNNFITASAGAQAIGESKYESKLDFIKQKIGIGKGFVENKNVHHGKKLEKIAILIYENIYNVKVGEFGLVPHISTPQIDFLGASPDGICTCSTLDGKFSNMVGRMLEIKCTTTRQINTEGKEDGEICPHYYWVQVQLQLECCDLEDCDFWQCKLKDYSDKDEWLEMITEDTYHTEQQNKKIEIKDEFKYGCLIELIPKNKDLPNNEKIEWYGKYIYPTILDTTIDKKIEWAEYMKNNWESIYPEFVTDYKFNKILYWHLEKSHCYLIKRDKRWFLENYHKFKETWDQVLFYRDNTEEKQKLINEEEEKKSKKIIRKDNISKKEKMQFKDPFKSDSEDEIKIKKSKLKTSSNKEIIKKKFKDPFESD